MSKVKDLVIIGGGYGGLITCLNAARNGLSVTVIERRGRMGGTCLNEGCIPSKCLLNSSYKLEEAKHHLGKFGVNVGNVQHDYAKMMKFKNDLLESKATGIYNRCKSLGIDIVYGYGSVLNKNEVAVKCNDGSEQVIKAKNIVLNMGSTPA